MEGGVQYTNVHTKSLFSYNFSSSGCLITNFRPCNLNAHGEQYAILSEITPIDVVSVQNNVIENDSPTPSASDLLDQLRAQLQEKVEQSEVLQLLALKGTGKMEASHKVAERIYSKRDYLARLVRTWAKWFEVTGKLPPAGQRGKHAKQRSALCDEDVKRKCIQFFRNTPQNK
ncbi:hypothetical protein V1520DRAFT_328992 [Lipomyces starkeyi]|uniref:Uncharacterized protein n=1 Tax=Lipomyces starkeyi NRRL Y-11557 TaxID=675824 RepID=A0A1E3PZC9_LIPST|nr:hypothetical protein LIPSTDRAFT_65937 [Lipomyces starkeyi NRRL Y-11557]